ncbi:hypothetical protein [Microbacterium hibisci]|uniref:hypothetical protein n=1 Tax=Microbacterium hibisci TaxID=2036000 RepID=UPI001944F0E0|nr:hypothetical protein [Microbacterium hibisci]
MHAVHPLGPADDAVGERMPDAGEWIPRTCEQRVGKGWGRRDDSLREPAGVCLRHGTTLVSDDRAAICVVPDFETPSDRDGSSKDDGHGVGVDMLRDVPGGEPAVGRSTWPVELAVDEQLADAVTFAGDRPQPGGRGRCGVGGRSGRV